MTESRTSDSRSGRHFLNAAAALLTLMGAPGAAAQGFYVGGGFYEYGPPPLISPRSVAFRLQDRGFTEIGRPRFDGETYAVVATDPAGARVRLFFDARNGAVVGRQRIDTPYYPTVRAARPGYGWTEEDMQPRRMARAGEAPIPPANIPDAVPRPPASLAPNASNQVPLRAGAAEPNPLGVNPDAKSRPVPAQRKTARLSDPLKATAARAAPPAPKPDSAETAKPVPPPETKAAATDAAEPPKAEPVAPATAPAIEAPRPDKAAADKPAVEEPKVAEAPRKEPAWQDPPAGERKVRVIDGATVVPGGGESPPPRAD